MTPPPKARVLSVVAAEKTATAVLYLPNGKIEKVTLDRIELIRLLSLAAGALETIDRKELS